MRSPWIRRAAIGLGVLVLLGVVAVAVLLATFDADRYKGLAIDWMKTERQRTLVIDGPIELSVFPRLALKVSKVRLSERGRNDEFAAVDEAALVVQILPLLRKQLVVHRVSARGVRVSYQSDAKGQRNIDDLLPGAAASAGAAAGVGASAPAGAALRLDVSAVQLDDLRLRLRDAMNKLDGEVVVQSLSTGRITNRAPTPVKLRASVVLTEPQALQLVLDANTSLAFDPDHGTVTLADLKLDTQIEGLAIKQLTIEAKRAMVNRNGQRFEFEALKLALAGGQGPNVPFELTLAWPQLAVATNSLKGSALSGQFKIGGPNALAGTLQSAAPSGTFDALRLPGLALTLQGKFGPRQIDANAKADLTLNAGRGALAIDKLDVRATLAEAGATPLQLAVQGKASADAKSAAWALDGALNSNKFGITGQAALGGAVPNIVANARFDSLDLNKLLAANKPGATTAATTGPSPADTPVALNGLNAVNGQFTFTAASFALRQYRVTDVKADTVLENGTLRVNRLAGRAWGGTIEASGAAMAKSQRVAVKLNADNVNVNAMLKDVAGKDLLEGTGRVVADVNSAGATVGAMRSNLAGTAALQLRDGAVKGVNLARSMRKAKAALSNKEDDATKAQSTEKTDFSELSASARIAGGVAHSDDLDLKSPYLRIAGAGRFDIGRGLIDYTARATVTSTAKGQDGDPLAALRGVTVPVHLTGQFEAMDWKIQWSGVAAAALQNKLKDKLAQKLGGTPGAAPAAGDGASAPATPKDKLKDRLKKLVR